MSKSTTPQILAAGTVLIRGVGASTEICLVHRPVQDDWSFPKGKLDPAETAVEAAWRETAEETGEHVELGVPLHARHYRVDGKLKRVDYWIGRSVVGGPGFRPTGEIDRLEWLRPRAAARKLTYERDRNLITEAVAAPRTSPLIVLRHAQALRRARWKKPKDSHRPLTAAGIADAKRLVPVLSAFGLDCLHSSDAVRCVDTLVPLAQSLNRRIVLESTLSEQGFAAHHRASLRRIAELARFRSPTVVCTHRPLMPALFEQLGKTLRIDLLSALDHGLPPGAMVVIHRRFTPKGHARMVAIERHEL